MNIRLVFFSILAISLQACTEEPPIPSPIDPNLAFLRGLLWRLTVVPVDNVAPDYGFVKVGPTVQPIIFSEQY